MHGFIRADWLVERILTMATLRTLKRKKLGNAYQVVYDIYEKNPTTGEETRLWKTEQFDDKAKAKRFKLEIEKKKADDALLKPSSETLTRFLYRWIDIYAKDKSWAPSTYEGNLSLMQNHIIPVLGGRRIQKLTPEVITTFFAELKDKKVLPKDNSRIPKDDAPCLSSKTRREIYNLLKCALNTAKVWKVIDEDLVVCERPAKGSKEVTPWDNSTLFDILEHMQDPLLHLAVHMAFVGTMRVGETVSIQWEQVDFEKSKIHIKQTLQRVKKSTLEKLKPADIYYLFPEQFEKSKSVLVLKAPKSEKSVRTIKISEPLKEELRKRKTIIEKQREYHGCDYQDHDLVFCLEDGRPIEGAKMTKRFREWQQEMDLGVKYSTFHGLRHSSVTSKLRASNGDIKSVQADSGHASADMILNVYGHIQEEDRKDMSAAFESAFYGQENVNEASKLDALLEQIKNNPELLKKTLDALQT